LTQNTKALINQKLTTQHKMKNIPHPEIALLQPDKLLTSVLYQEIPIQKLERANLCDKLPLLLREWAVLCRLNLWSPGHVIFVM
jgi:hypothetical protein